MRGAAPQHVVQGWFASFLRLFVLCALAPTMRRAAPVFALLVVAAGLVLQAIPLHQLMAHSPHVVPGVAVAWAVALSHARAPLFGAPATEYLRSLPLPTAAVTAALMLALLALDLPLIALCVASGSPAAALVGPSVSMATHAALGSRRRRWLAALPPVVVAASLFSPWIALAPALVIAGGALPWAWSASRGGQGAHAERFHIADPCMGLARALVRAVRRSEAPALRRAACLLVIMTGAAALAIRNNDLTSFAAQLRACLISLAIGLPLMTMRVAAATLERGWQLAFLCQVTGVTMARRTLAGALALAAFGVAIGAVFACAVAIASRSAHALPLTAAGAAGGAALAVVSLGVAAAAAKGEAIDPARQLAGSLALITAGAVGFAESTLGATLASLPLGVCAALVYRLRLSPRSLG